MSTEEQDMRVSLKEYVKAILDEREKALINTASSLELRLAHLNQLRENVMTKAEYLQAHENLGQRIIAIEKWQSRLIGIGIAVAFGSGLIGAVLSHLIGWK